jgi:hypothetical protein
MLNQEEEHLREGYASLIVYKQKIQHLASSTAILSSVDFSVCPRCLSGITAEMKQREQFARCCLCNRPITITSDTRPSTMPKVDDINLQINETEVVLENILKEKQVLEEELVRHRSLESEVSKALDEETQVYISPSIDLLLEQSYDVIQKEVVLTEARRIYQQALSLHQLENRLDELKSSKAILEHRLREALKPNIGRLEHFRQIYEDILRLIDFPGLKSCTIDPQTLMPSINGSLYVTEGAALRALAVVCYHLALLELARQEQTYFPLFLVIDSPAFGEQRRLEKKLTLRSIGR